MAVKNDRYEDFPVRFLPLGPLLGLLIAILLKKNQHVVLKKLYLIGEPLKSDS